MTSRTSRFGRIGRSRGLTMIELLVALAVGGVVIAGAVYVYDQSRRTYTTNDNVARIQEQARFVFSLVEAELQHAGYYGYTNSPNRFRLRTATVADAGIADMRQANVTANSVPVAAHACGRNFATDVYTPVQGSNDTYQLGAAATVACNPVAASGGYEPGTDTFTVRRASTNWLNTFDTNRLQVFVGRMGVSANILSTGVATLPQPVVEGLYEVRNLVVRTFYVSQDSEGFAGVPALRMRSLRELNAVGGAYSDDELASGVEDLQVQFGIDTGSYDGDNTLDNDIALDGTPDTNGQATRYVSPDDALVDPTNEDAAQVVSVRIWLRVRGDAPEQGFVDTRTYSYAGVNYTPAGDDAQFRRILVSRTIQLRNARTL